MLWIRREMDSSGQPFLYTVICRQTDSLLKEETTMKRTFAKAAAIVLSFAMLTSLAGCGSSGSSKVDTTAAATSAQTEGTAGESGSEGENQDNSGITITYGLTSPWSTLNPYSSNAGGLYAGLVQDKIYDKLFYINAGGKSISPRNAESWEFDGKTLTVHLNENAKWHDGEPVTAADWVYTAQLLTNPDVPFTSRSNMNIFDGTDENGVETGEDSVGFTATDDYTLTITMKDQHSEDDLTDLVVNNMKQFMVLPKHILGEIPDGEVLDNDSFRQPVGSGPCKFVSEIVDSELTLAANEDYYLGAPKFGTLVMRVVASSNVVTSIMSGELDYAFPFLSVDDFLAATDEGLDVKVSDDADKLNMLIINTSTITDSRIRLAMQYAINKEAMVNSVMQGYAVVADSCMLPNSEYLDANLDGGQNTEKAKELLEEAGYDGTTYKIAVPSGYRVQLANMIRQDLAAVGINLEIETVDAPTMFAGIQDGTYDMMIMADTMTNYVLTAEWYYDATAANYSSLTDMTFNEKMDAIKVCTDDAQLKELADDFQEYCFEQSPLIPLFYQYNFALTSERLTNFVPFDSQMFNDAVWTWEIAE